MDANESRPKRPRGRPRKDLQGDKFGHLIPYERVRIDGVSWWKCHCLGCTVGAGARLNCKQGREDILVRHSNLAAGLHKSCGCLKYVREPRVGDVRLTRRDKVTADDFIALGLPLPSWVEAPPPVSVKGMDIDSDEYWAALDAMPVKGTD